MVDDRGHAGVGGAQHGAAGFQRAHLRDLQVLVRCERVAEPCDVADVDEQGRLGQDADDFLAERVFVADIDRDFLAGERSCACAALPREKSESGIFKIDRTQAKPGE